MATACTYCTALAPCPLRYFTRPTLLANALILAFWTAVVRFLPPVYPTPRSFALRAPTTAFVCDFRTIILTAPTLLATATVLVGDTSRPSAAKD